MYLGRWPLRPCCCQRSPSRGDPSNHRNRDSPANGARWAGRRAAATAYRAPTRRRLLSPRTVGVRPAGARAAVTASAEDPPTPDGMALLEVALNRSHREALSMWLV